MDNIRYNKNLFILFKNVFDYTCTSALTFCKFCKLILNPKVLSNVTPLNPKLTSDTLQFSVIEIFLKNDVFSKTCFT